MCFSKRRLLCIHTRSVAFSSVGVSVPHAHFSPCFAFQLCSRLPSQASACCPPKMPWHIFKKCPLMQEAPPQKFLMHSFYFSLPQIAPSRVGCSTYSHSVPLFGAILVCCPLGAQFPWGGGWGEGGAWEGGGTYLSCLGLAKTVCDPVHNPYITVYNHMNVIYP